ncbi:hypothetical protein AAG570_012139 [Ranatra chinensis]|uniref:Enoyl reductase (ER) domain-containing protein n=1 Tax=Ranatra chinensis TaxID=642074 RepID=A0ABD0Z494_9HEMI
MVLPKLPAVLGKEASGIIEEVGSDVNKLKVGDRVVCCLPWNGGYAEYVTCDEKDVFILPEKLTFPQGAALYVAYFTAYRALVTMGKIKKGESLLVHGASGAVGIAAVQIAKAKGLMVVGTAGSDEGRQIVKSVGADFVVNHKDRKSCLELYSSKSSGFDIILETCAHINLEKDLLLLNQKGRIAVVGSRGPIEINPRSLIYTEGNIFGVKLIGITEDDFKESVEAITKGIEEGWVNPIVAKEYKMQYASRAHEELINNTGARGKIVFVM